MTELLFRENSYAKSCRANVMRIEQPDEQPDAIVFDRTVFFARSGGQQGDQGTLKGANKTLIVEDCVYAPDGNILHLLQSPSEGLPQQGEELELTLDWQRRYAMMRLHTAMHLLCSMVPHGVTGGNIAPDKARLDFDCGGEALDKETLQQKLDQLVKDDRSVKARWVEEEVLQQNPQLVRTLSVQPPKGQGRVRIIDIEECDSQPCGGTHVNSTAEVGAVLIGKIENKGKHNRRISLRLETSHARA